MMIEKIKKIRKFRKLNKKNILESIKLMIKRIIKIHKSSKPKIKNTKIYDLLNEYDRDNRKGFYNSLNGVAIIDFKWRTFGRYYYFLIWFMFMIFQICFIIRSSPLTFNNDLQYQLYLITIFIGFIHLSFELRQFI